jgi:hypothetical protein
LKGRLLEINPFTIEEFNFAFAPEITCISTPTYAKFMSIEDPTLV